MKEKKLRNAAKMCSLFVGQYICSLRWHNNGCFENFRFEYKDYSPYSADLVQSDYCVFWKHTNLKKNLKVQNFSIASEVIADEYFNEKTCFIFLEMLKKLRKPCAILNCGENIWNRVYVSLGRTKNLYLILANFPSSVKHDQMFFFQPAAFK